MSKFVLTAQLQLRAPTNVAQVAKQIQKQLSNVSVNVQVKGGAQATKQMTNLTKATQAANTAAYQLGKTFASSLKRFAAFSVATRFVSVFTQGLGGAVDEAIKFERELIKVAQVTGKTVSQLSELTAEIRKLSTSLGVSSAELLNVTRQLSQAGLSAYETKVALDALAKSSLAPTFEDMAKTAEGAIAIFNQFGKGAAALEGQLGAINAVAGQFAVEAGDLISVIRRTGGVFKAAGGDLNELIALFTSVRATTRESAESIATGLRTIFTRIQRPRTIKFLQQLGVSLTDVEGKFVGPFEAIKRLSAALGDLEQGDLAFVRIAEELGGFRQIGKVIPLLQQFATAQDAYNTALAGSNSLSKDAEVAQDTLVVKLTKLREEFLAVMRTITDSTGFKIMADAAISLAKAVLQISEALTPLLPLLTAFAGIKLAKGLGGFLAGARAGGLGAVPKFATGGMVPGSGSRDTVPAMLTPGEFVIRKSSVQKIGSDNLKSMNAKGYAHGGTVKGQIKDNVLGIFALRSGQSGAESSLASENGKKDITNKKGAITKLNSEYNLGLKGGNKLDAFSENLTGPDQRSILENSDKGKQVLKDMKTAYPGLKPPTGSNTGSSLGEGSTAFKKYEERNTDAKKNLNEAIKSAEIPGADLPTQLTLALSTGKQRELLLGSKGRKGLTKEVEEQIFSETANRLATVSEELSKLNSGAIGEVKKGIEPQIQFNKKNFDESMANLIKNEKDDWSQAVRSTGGFVQEGLLAGLTGAKVGGGGTPFDFPDLKDHKERLSNLYAGDMNSILSGDAKPDTGKKNVGELIKKLANSMDQSPGTFVDKAYIPKLGFAKGGPAPSDTVPAMLTPGEFVINKKAAQSIGQASLNQMNKKGVQGFAAGGAVGGVKHFQFGGAAGAGAGGMGLLMMLPALQMGFEKLYGASEETSDVFNATKVGVQTLISNLLMTKGALHFFTKQTQDAGDAEEDNTKATNENTQEKKETDQKMELSGSLSIRATGELIIKGITTVILHAQAVQMGEAAQTADPSAANKVDPMMAALSTSAPAAPAGPALPFDQATFKAFTSSLRGQGTSVGSGNALPVGLAGINTQKTEAQIQRNAFQSRADEDARLQAAQTKESQDYQFAAGQVEDLGFSPEDEPLKTYLDRAKYFAEQAEASGERLEKWQGRINAADAATGSLAAASATMTQNMEQEATAKDALNSGPSGMPLAPLPATQPISQFTLTEAQAAGPPPEPPETNAKTILDGWAKSLGGLVESGKQSFKQYWGDVFQAVEDQVDSSSKVLKGIFDPFVRIIREEAKLLSFAGIKKTLDDGRKMLGDKIRGVGTAITTAATESNSKIVRGFAQVAVVIGDSSKRAAIGVGKSLKWVGDKIRKGGTALATAIKNVKDRIKSGGGGGLGDKLAGFGKAAGKFTVGLASMAASALSFAGAIAAAAAAYTQAKFDKAVQMGDYQGGMSMIDANYQTQDTSARLGSAVTGMASGAALGATIGSVIPGIGTAIGGAIGAIGGGIAGFFKDDLLAMVGLGPSSEEREKSFREKAEAQLAQADLSKNLAPKLGEQLESFSTGGIATTGGAAALEGTLDTIGTMQERIASIGKVDPDAAKAAEKQLEAQAFGLAATIGSTAQSNAEMEAAMQKLVKQFPELQDELQKAAKSARLVAEANRAQAKLRADMLVTSSVFRAASLEVNNFVDGLKTGANSWNATIATLEEAQANIALGTAGTEAVAEARDRVNQQLGASGVGADSGARQAINRQFDTLETAAKFTSNLPAVLQGAVVSKDTDQQVVKDDLTDQLLQAAGVSADSDIGKIIQGNVSALTPEQVQALQSGTMQLSDVFKDMSGQVAALGNGALEAAKAMQAHENTITALTGERIKAERNLIATQKRAIDLQLEAAQIASEFGGAAVTAEQRRNAAIEKFNLTAGRVGAGALGSGTGADIRNSSAALANQFAAQELTGRNSGAFAGSAGLDADKRAEVISAQQELIGVTKALIEADKQELDIIKKKNALEKSSMDALISGDVDKFFSQQAAAQATQVLAAGGDVSGFGADTLAAARENIKQQREGGVSEIGGRSIRDVEAAATAAALASRGISDPRAVALASGQTQEEQEIESRIRDRAGALGAIGDNMATMAEMQVQSAEIAIQTANVVFKQGLANAAGQIDMPVFARGGMVYASRGMFIPKGTDTVPAMLTPGEFVVNRSAVNRGNNLQMLKAINSGNQSSDGAAPAAMSQGGQVGYYANGGTVAGGMDASILEGLNAFNSAFAQNIANLQNTKFQIKLDTTNVNVNLNGGSFLNSMKDEVKTELLAEIGSQISSLKFNDAGEPKVNNSVLG